MLASKYLDSFSSTNGCSGIFICALGLWIFRTYTFMHEMVHGHVDIETWHKMPVQAHCDIQIIATFSTTKFHETKNTPSSVYFK